MAIKIILLVLFFGVMVAVGLYCRRQATDVNGFVLGGRSVGPWLTAFAYGTSYFSAVIFIGYAGQFGWKFGASATWIGLGNAFLGSLLAWVVLGRRTRLMTQKLETATMPDFFAKRYNSKGLRTFASVILFVFLIPYTASLYNGLSRLFEMAFGIDYTYCVIAMAVLTGLYVLLGGYMATAVNDFIQGLIMLFGIIAVIAAVLNGHGGFMGSMEKLSQIASDVRPNLSGAFTSLLGPEPLNLLFVVLLTSLGTWGLPQMVGKFYAIRSEEAISKGTIISTIFAVIVAGGCYFLGGFGRIYGDSIARAANGNPIYDSIVPTMLSTLPDILIGVVVILVLSASMSTLSSLVLTSGSSLTLDIVKPLRPNMDEKRTMLSIRLWVVFFIIVSSLLALVQAKSSVTFIAQLMGISWGALAGAFLAPFLYGLYWKRVTRTAVIVNFISGVGIMCACMFCSFTGRTFITPFLSSPIQAGVLAMLAGLVIVPIVSLMTKAPDKELVADMFSCYDRTVTVRATTSLQDSEE